MAEPADPALVAYLATQGYFEVRTLETGEVAGLQRMVFTTGLFVGITRDTWRTRFCYPTAREALTALDAWNGKGWPPGYWIKQKPEEITNPTVEGEKLGIPPKSCLTDETFAVLQNEVRNLIRQRVAELGGEPYDDVSALISMSATAMYQHLVATGKWGAAGARIASDYFLVTMRRAEAVDIAKGTTDGSS